MHVAMHRLGSKSAMGMLVVALSVACPAVTSLVCLSACYYFVALVDAPTTAKCFQLQLLRLLLLQEPLCRPVADRHRHGLCVPFNQ
jgi:hypothetical protein